MSSFNQKSVLSLETNRKEQYVESVNILLKLLDNVIRDPNNPKFRSVRLENKTIKEKLICLPGMEDVLLAIGFQKTLSEYVLPTNVIIATIKKYREFLEERLHHVLARVESDKEASVTKQDERTDVCIVPLVPYYQRITFPSVLTTINPFLRNLEHLSDSVMQYEDTNLQAAGRSLVPIEDMTQKASEKLLAIQEAIEQKKFDGPQPCIRDLLLVELANWFNTEFFEWVNTLPCKVCGRDDTGLRRTQVEDNVRVEVGICCGEETKFYRYNDVAKLLASRKGRCGEYANCFTFICRCFDFDARLVMSQFDHVWTEVYSESQKRWIHVDPSDNIVDSPLAYEHGWKRQIDYILAYSKDDVQDVTWRYTSDHKRTLSVRKRCSEVDLLRTILALRKKRQNSLTKEQRKILAVRTFEELIQLTVQRSPTENELKGRSSGSLSWRQERGEQSFCNIFVFELSDVERKERQFNLRYSCANDVYERYIKGAGDGIEIHSSYKTWQSAQFSSKNIFRKVERDWKMVYLSREENTDSAEIQWKFDFSKDNLRVKDYSLKFERKTYENGHIDLSVESLTGSPNVTGATGFVIRARMSGGKGDIAWQHTQLFRQSLNSKEFPFDLNVRLQ